MITKAHGQGRQAEARADNDAADPVRLDPAVLTTLSEQLQRRTRCLPALDDDTYRRMLEQLDYDEAAISGRMKSRL